MEYSTTSSLKVNVEMIGITAIESIFDHVSHIPDDWRDAWEPMAADFRASEAEIFAEEGPGWAPLSPRYAQWKAHHYPGMPLLVRTGALAASLIEADSDGNINELYPTEMKLGSDLKTKDGRYTLGMLHQTGTRPHKGSPDGMTARPPVIVRPSLQRQWHSRLANWLRDELDYKG